MPKNEVKSEARRNGLRKIKSRPSSFFMVLMGLYFFAAVLFKAAHRDRLEWTNRFGPNVPISYADHPWAYAWIVIICALGALGCLGVAWIYLFLKVPE